MPAATKQEAIAFLCRRAAQAHHLPDDFERLVWEREEAAPTAFGAGVAMPHPMRAVADETFVAVGMTDEPIDWDGQRVRAVFLIAIAPEGHEELEEFFETLAAFFIDSASVQKLLEHPEFERFLALIQTRKER